MSKVIVAIVGLLIGMFSGVFCAALIVVGTGEDKE